MNVYVVRHGQTDWNKQNLLLGNTDIPLNEFGKFQTLKLKQTLMKINFDYIISSDLTRAFETAKIINSSCPIIKNSNLRERYYGNLEGTTPKNIHKFWDVKSNINESNVEPLKVFLSRIFSEMDNLLLKYNNADNLLIVTHYGVIMAIDAYFNNKFNYCFDHFILNNCEYKKYIL